MNHQHGDYIIREIPATEDALAPLVELHHQCLPSRHGATPEQKAKVFADIVAALTGRDPHVLGAFAADGGCVGYKIAYRTGNRRECLYSWLGGVHPFHRRKGLARAMLRLQHEHAKANGYQYIETHTWGDNREMLILNLQEGFIAVGTLSDNTRTGAKLVLRRTL